MAGPAEAAAPAALIPNGVPQGSGAPWANAAPDDAAGETRAATATTANASREIPLWICGPAVLALPSILCISLIPGNLAAPAPSSRLPDDAASPLSPWRAPAGGAGTRRCRVGAAVVPSSSTPDRPGAEAEKIGDNGTGGRRPALVDAPKARHTAWHPGRGSASPPKPPKSAPAFILFFESGNTPA